MKEERLLNALGGIDDSLIKRAAPVPQKNRKYAQVKWAVIAACFILAVCISIPILHQIQGVNDYATDSLADYPAMVMINGILYYDSGEISTSPKSDVMDGEILSMTAGEPSENNQSNFGTGYGYQYGANHTIEICMDEGDWHIFIPYDTENQTDWDNLSEKEKMERNPTYNTK